MSPAIPFRLVNTSDTALERKRGRDKGGEGEERRLKVREWEGRNGTYKREQTEGERENPVCRLCFSSCQDVFL